MRVATAWRSVVVTAAVAALASGCGVFDSGATATNSATTTTRDIDKIVVFNPCTQLADEVLVSLGLNPASKSVVTDAPTGPTSWRVCHWMPVNRQYAVSVFSTSHTLDEARTNDNHIDIRETTVGGRPAIYSRDKADTKRDSCYVSFTAQQGMFEINATWVEGDPGDGDICAMAKRYADDLEPHLPE